MAQSTDMVTWDNITFHTTLNITKQMNIEYKHIYIEKSMLHNV